MSREECDDDDDDDDDDNDDDDDDDKIFLYYGVTFMKTIMVFQRASITRLKINNCFLNSIYNNYNSCYTGKRYDL